MKRLGSRVADLEARQEKPFGAVHRLIQHEGQSRDEAIDAYGRERIGSDDLLIIRRIVSPRFNPDGSMLFYSDWPENQPPAKKAPQPLGRIAPRR